MKFFLGTDDAATNKDVDANASVVPNRVRRAMSLFFYSFKWPLPLPLHCLPVVSTP